jgi:prevent-host-death family protein
MQKVVIGAWEARRTFGKVLDTVGYRGDAVVVEKNGERLAAIAPIQMLDKWEEQRKAFFDQMRVVFERADVPYEEAMMKIANMQWMLRRLAPAYYLL